MSEKASKKYVLEGEYSTGTKIRCVLVGDRITVGRSGDLTLQEPSVSREHAVLTWNGDAWRVSDVGSRNGTFVNGVSVQRKLLVPGDRVKFGRVSMTLIDPDNECSGDETVTWAATSKTVDAMSALTAGPGAQALVGRSEALKSAMRVASRAAKSNATVLLFGESGTGKELFAKLVWEESERRDKKFLPVHSGAIEPSLLASALFGYEKGAFTGADKQHKGLFEEADGGTIFLDEIGEINAETQVKLLRVLQEGEFLRVGGTEPIKVDVRVICATNRNLAEAVREGKFREDLYYRLNVIQIHLPPLRERRGDVEDLINHYVKQLGGPFKSISKEAMAALCRYGWPGNVRELRNTVERMVVLSEREELGLSDLPAEIQALAETPQTSDGQTEDSTAETPSAETPPAPSSLAIEDWEKQAILGAMAKCDGNKRKAADLLHVSRTSLYAKLRKFGIE